LFNKAIDDNRLRSPCATHCSPSVAKLLVYGEAHSRGGVSQQEVTQTGKGKERENIYIAPFGTKVHTKRGRIEALPLADWHSSAVSLAVYHIRHIM